MTQSTEISRTRQIWPSASDSVPNIFTGSSHAAAELLHQVEDAASVDVGVLVFGETGAGKELVARAIHERSRRSGGPFQAVNCAAIQDNLAEAELFGHARGAFTGANEARKGWFEATEGGTLLLDEIGEMPPGQQAKLLRVLQNGRFSAVGEAAVRQSNVRVIAATHRDLDGLVREGRFRKDLLNRLNVLRICVPSLRERAEDIPIFAHDFAKKFAAAGGLGFAGFANGVFGPTTMDR
jgi:transcriptional regulator with GAF, ATPase, and Fis domain